MKKILHMLFAIIVLLPLAQADEVTYFIPDASGSPVAAMDEDANIIWRKHYTPFGAEIETTNANRVSYTGHVKDQTTGLLYMGQRYFDPTIPHFMSMDPAPINPEDPRTFNRYNYANNNSYRYVDPDGRWPSQSGFYVHQRATYLVIGHSLPSGENKILAQAQVIADSGQYQGGNSAYRHAMRSENETAGQARTKANSFVRNQFQKAWEAKSREQALTEFGIALHVLQDSTSPAHGGFQEWTGHETVGQEAKHVATELYNPGKDSNLYKITADAWKWFEKKKLPDGDLFTRGSD